MKLDKTDRQILEVLQSRGRITNADLAKQVGLSPAPTLERVRKLERLGVIEGYHARLNLSAVGLGIETFVEVTLSKHRQDAIQQFMEAVRKIPQITDCYHITGRADFLLRVAVTDMAAYEDFLLHTLSALPALQHVETMIIMRTVKDGRQLPINHQPTKGDS